MMEAERLVEDLAHLGLIVEEGIQASWLAALERVKAELGEGIAARAMAHESQQAPSEGTGRVERRSGADRSGGRPSLNDSPWVWRPDQPLAPTGSGPLDGIGFAVKDLLAVAGRPLRAGSRVRADAPVEPIDAAVVASLRAAGAALVGTTKLHEFAFGVTGINTFEGSAANPAAPGRVTGGSSSGSAAAVAAGEVAFALGTDTGGSCRIPAACCAVVGFKPSFGLVDNTGVFPLAPSLDHVGWLAVDVAMARRVAEVLGVVAVSGEGPTPSAATDLGQRPRKLGVARRAVDAADADVREAFAEVERVLRARGWELVEVNWPGAEEAFAASTAILFTEAAYVHRAALPREPLAYGADVRARLVQGRMFDLATYLRARERRDRLRARSAAVLAKVTAVIGPTVSVVPPLIELASDPAVASRLVATTRLANVTGFPAISVPVPNRTLPVGIQIEAAHDETVFIVAAALEAALRRAG